MKKLSIFFSVLLISAVAFAQNFELPKTGAKIYLSKASIEVGVNDETTLELWIVRSKRAKKSKFDAPKFLGSKDVEFTITQNPENPDYYKVTLRTKDVKTGKYFYTISSRSRSTQKVTGTTASVIVGESEKIIAADNN
ncbi:MAG: hypothetical protein RIM99_17745 [Cyclobacteriaceae bacterium]